MATDITPIGDNDRVKGSVKWTRRVRQLTNERVINLPKQLEYFETGDKVVLAFDGESINIRKSVAP